MARLLIYCGLIFSVLYHLEAFKTNGNVQDGEKFKSLFDYSTNVVAYKHIFTSTCYIERLQNVNNKNAPEKLPISARTIDDNKLSRQQILDISGQRVADFCKGSPTYLIIQNYSKNNSNEQSNLRYKRYVRRHRGQTQSQYLNVGTNAQPGKAEAEATPDSTKAVVSGNSGMGQAQSQSNPYGCDECYNQEQGIQYQGRPAAIASPASQFQQPGVHQPGQISYSNQPGPIGQTQLTGNGQQNGNGHLTGNGHVIPGYPANYQGYGQPGPSTGNHLPGAGSQPGTGSTYSGWPPQSSTAPRDTTQRQPGLLTHPGTGVQPGQTWQPTVGAGQYGQPGTLSQPGTFAQPGSTWQPGSTIGQPNAWQTAPGVPHSGVIPGQHGISQTQPGIAAAQPDIAPQQPGNYPTHPGQVYQQTPGQISGYSPSIQRPYQSANVHRPADFSANVGGEQTNAGQYYNSQGGKFSGSFNGLYEHPKQPSAQGGTFSGVFSGQYGSTQGHGGISEGVIGGTPTAAGLDGREIYQRPGINNIGSSQANSLGVPANLGTGYDVPGTQFPYQGSYAIPGGYGTQSIVNPPGEVGVPAGVNVPGGVSTGDGVPSGAGTQGVFTGGTGVPQNVGSSGSGVGSHSIQTGNQYGTAQPGAGVYGSQAAPSGPGGYAGSQAAPSGPGGYVGSQAAPSGPGYAGPHAAPSGLGGYPGSGGTAGSTGIRPGAYAPYGVPHTGYGSPGNNGVQGVPSQFGIPTYSQGPPGGQYGTSGLGVGSQYPYSGIGTGGQTMPNAGNYGIPTGYENVPNGLGGVPSNLQTGVTGGGDQGIDDGDSQVQTSVQQTNNETHASASALGKYAASDTSSHVSGTYTGLGSFSASAGSNDGKRGAQTQVSGGKEGAISSAQGQGGSGTSQAQVQLSSETGETISTAQSNGIDHGTNTQVQAGVKGGMADAQANGPGSSSSQAQIGFSPHEENEEDDQETPFHGGGTAAAQGGRNSGQTQVQLQGKFRYGIKYTGSAQAGSGNNFSTAQNRNQSQFTFTNIFPTFKPLVFSSRSNESTSHTQVSQKADSAIGTSKKRTNSTIANKANKQRTTTTLAPPHNEEEYVEEYDNDYEENPPPEHQQQQNGQQVPEHNAPILEPASNHHNQEEQSVQAATNQREDNIQAAPSSRQEDSGRSKVLIEQSTPSQSQHIVLDPLEDIDATVTQAKGNELEEGALIQPGQAIPGSNGYRVPQGFRGVVKSVSNGRHTAAIGRNSQAQSVSLHPGTGHVRYRKPLYGVASTTQTRNGRYSFGSGHTIQPSHQFRTGINNPKFVSLTKSEIGSQDALTGVRTPSIYYTQSSSCGYFTNTCVYQNGIKICTPKPMTNADGTPIVC